MAGTQEGTVVSPANRPSTPSGLIIGLEIIKLLNGAIWPATILGCVYFGITRPIQASVGQSTAVGLSYTLLADFKLHIWLPYAVALVFGVLWRKERQTRIKAVAREHKRIEALERKLDPNRTSSGFEE